MQIGALEAGGTKMVCAIGDEFGKIHTRISIPTKDPESTMQEMIAFYKKYSIEALGIACFGPLDLHLGSPTYGYITTTPKDGWQFYDILGTFKRELQIPAAIDTDVNGSVLGEATWGALRGVDNGMYITIGTGIGAGILSNGKLLHGMLHPEAGHMLLHKHPSDTYIGRCRYHRHCFEGMASGPAIEERWGKSAKELAKIDDVWKLEAYYIGQAVVNYIVVLSPQRIVLGGGVMHQNQLMPLIHEEVRRQLNGYIKTKEMDELEKYIVLPELGDNQGIMGALMLGRKCME